MNNLTKKGKGDKMGCLEVAAGIVLAIVFLILAKIGFVIGVFLAIVLLYSFFGYRRDRRRKMRNV